MAKIVIEIPEELREFGEAVASALGVLPASVRRRRPRPPRGGDRGRSARYLAR